MTQQEEKEQQHKPLTVAQNVKLTIKIVIGAALVLAAIGILDSFTG